MAFSCRKGPADSIDSSYSLHNENIFSGSFKFVFCTPCRFPIGCAHRVYRAGFRELFLPTSVSLLRIRMNYSTVRRKVRLDYSRRMWGLFFVFFILFFYGKNNGLIVEFYILSWNGMSDLVSVGNSIDFVLF